MQFWWAQGERKEGKKQLFHLDQIIGLNIFLAKKIFFQERKKGGAVQWQEPEGKIRAVHSSWSGDFAPSVITAQQHKVLWKP